MRYETIEVRDSAHWERFRSLGTLAGPGADQAGAHGADAHRLLVDRRGEAVARCSLWWTDVPRLNGHRVGLIGHYAACHGGAGRELLRLAVRTLAAHSCMLAVGPMDGSTYRRYRLITERGREPLFFLEQNNPDDWPRHFAASGFGPLATYCSTLVADLARDNPREPGLDARLRSDGITLRPLDLAHIEEELRRLYSVATASFERNLLYSPISSDDFVGLYLPIRPHVRPELALIAERRDRPVGFVFAIPDLLQARRGEAVDTVIVKTLAVHPDCAGRGLGTALAVHCQEVARELGYRRAIHALMHEDNRSRRMSARCNARVIRRYTLFSREL